MNVTASEPDTDWKMSGTRFSCRRYRDYQCYVEQNPGDGRWNFQASRSGYDGRAFFDSRASNQESLETLEDAQLACEQTIRWKYGDE